MSRRHLAVPLYIGGGSLSLFGNSAISIVLPWLVLGTTGSLSSAGIIAAASAAAAVPATFAGGRLIDRFGARNVAVVADLGSATAVLGLIVVSSTVGLSLPWFMVLGAAGAVFDVPGMTARQAMLVDVSGISGTSVEKVAGLFQAGFSLAFLAGPALAGLLLSVLEPIDVVAVTAACSGGAALMTAVVPVMGRAFDAGGGQPGSAWDLIRATPALRAMLIIAFSASLVTPPMIGLLLPGHFNEIGEPGQLGLAMSAFAVGALVGSALFALLARRSKRSAYVSGLATMTAGVWMFAQLEGFWIVAAGMLVMGVGSGLFGPIWNVYVAEQVPADVRGRVLGWLNAGGLVAGPMGLGLMSVVLLGDDLGLGAVVMAVGWTAVATYAVLSPSARQLTEPPAQPAAVPR
jgi:MFS family permease